MVAMVWLAWLMFAAPEANLLANGDFETGAASWLPGPELAEFGTFQVGPGRGGQIAKLTNRGDTALVYVHQRLAVERGKVYRVTGQIMSPPLRETAGLAVVAFNAAGEEVHRAWAHHLPAWGAASFQTFEGTYRPPAETVTIEIRLAVYRPGEVAFDDLVVTATDPPKQADPWGLRLTDFGLTAERLPVPVPAYTVAVDGDGAPAYLDIEGRLVCLRNGQRAWTTELGGFPISLAHGQLSEGEGQWLACAAVAPDQPPLRAFDSAGRPRWSWPGDGRLPNRATTGDVDGDGSDEVLVTSGNQLIVLSAEGQEIWRRNFGGPRQRIACVGSESADGQRQVFAGIDAQNLFAASFAADGTPRWKFQPGGGVQLPADDVAAADLDGDGRDEVLISSEGGQVACLAAGELRWLASRERPKLWPQHPLSTANLTAAFPRFVVADFIAERRGLETLVALIDQLWMLDSGGKFIWESQSGLLLADLVPAPDGSLYAPSGGFRDPALYRLTPVRDGRNPLAEATAPAPELAQLDAVAQQIDAAPARPAPVSKRSVIFANLPRPESDQFEARLREIDALFKSLENQQLEYVAMLWPKDLPVELHRGPLVPPDRILAAARLFESLGRPFLFFACHGAAPNLSIDILRRTLEVAPNTCRGFYVAENMEQYGSRRWPDFLAWTSELLKLCRQHGKQLIFKEMYEAWSSVAALPDVRSTVLRPEYRDTVVAMYATNNPHAPELQLAGMIGLQHAGRIAAWGISTQYWNWSWSEHTLQMHWPNLCPPDVILRMELAAACLGARWFHIEGGQEYLLRDQAAIDPRARRHREMVYAMIRKGLLPDVPPDDHLEFSNLVLARSAWPGLSERITEGQSLGSAMGRASDLRAGLLGVGEAMQTVHAGYLPATLCGTRQYTGSMFPAMPHGWLRSVPDDAQSADWLAGKTALRTDGVTWGQPPAQPLDQLVAKADQALGVQCADAAVMGLRLANSWRIYVIDDAYLAPRERRVSITLRLPAGRVSGRDLLSGEAIEIESGRLAIHLPAGGFRVIEVEPAG